MCASLCANHLTLPHAYIYCTGVAYIYPSVSKVHAGSFRASAIHRTLTWTTGSLTCIRDHSLACVYTRGFWGTPTASQHNIFDSEKLSQVVSCASVGVRTAGHGIHWISRPTLYQLSHPVTPRRDGEITRDMTRLREVSKATLPLSPPERLLQCYNGQRCEPFHS